MDKIFHEKETIKAQEVPSVIPMVTTIVPSTLAEDLAPKVPLAIALPVTSSTTSATESSTISAQHSEEDSKIVKAMEDMSLQTSVINRLKKVIDNLEDTKKLAQINAKTHEQRNNRLNVELKNLQQDLTLKEPMSYVKNQLWNKIIEAINDVWPSIQVIYEQKDLLKVAQAEIQKTKDEIGNKPEQNLELIKFLNGKNK